MTSSSAVPPDRRLSERLEWIVPEWPAPPNVRALATTRQGGFSKGSYAGLNLGLGSGDEREAVDANRALLMRAAALPGPPCWLHQVHGRRVVPAATATTATTKADGCVAERPGRVCAVLTADCLPVLFCDRAGTRVAAAHAGWRGLAAGVLEATVEALGSPGRSLLAWLGPAIGPSAYEVGTEVRAAFLATDPEAAAAFVPSPGGRWLADLYLLARQRLNRAGVESVFGGHWCTFSDARRFYSHRRDGRSGRMASLIWLAPSTRPSATA